MITNVPDSQAYALGFSCCDKTQGSEASWEERVYLADTFHITGHRQRKSGQAPRGQTSNQRQQRSKCCLQVDS